MKRYKRTEETSSLKQFELIEEQGSVCDGEQGFWDCGVFNEYAEATTKSSSQDDGLEFTMEAHCCYEWLQPTELG